MVVKVIFEVDMRLGSKGLTELLKEKRISRDVTSSSMFMFMNRRKTQVKILWNESYCLSYRKGSVIDVEDLKAIPSYFKGQLFKNNTLEQQLIKHIGHSPSVHLDEEGVKVS